MGRVDPAGLFDRDRELSAVGALLDDAASGAGGLLLVEGEAGIGKTGIVRAAGALARASGLRVLGARGSELESGLAFGLVREMFSEPIRAADKDELGALFAGAAALARPVLEPAVEQVLDESHDSFATLHGLYWFVAGLCSAAPTLLAVDDAHWSDLPSLRFLAYLARRLDGLKLALLVTARPEEAEQQELLRLLASEPQAVQVRPRPLGRASVHAMVSAALGPAEDRFVDACQAVTGGNPFLLTELLADLRDAAVPPLASHLDRVKRPLRGMCVGPFLPVSAGFPRVPPRWHARLRCSVTVWMPVVRLGSPGCRRTRSICWWTPWLLPGSSSRAPC